MSEKRLFFYALLLHACTALTICSFADDMTFEDREALFEELKKNLNGEGSIHPPDYCQGIYVDGFRAVFLHAIVNAGEKRNPATVYVERYDFAQKKRERMIPYELWKIISSPKKRSLDIPKQIGLFKKDGGAVSIEMDYVSGEWKELGFCPIEGRPRDVQWVSEPTRFAFPYPQNGFEHNNPDLFGLDVVDVETGERKNILSQIKCQLHVTASWGDKFVYLFLNENTLLYSETMNPYRFKDDEGNPLSSADFNRQFSDNPQPHNVLWRMNVASGEKIQLATRALSARGKLVLRDGTVVWNRVEIGSATDILQRK